MYIISAVIVFYCLFFKQKTAYEIRISDWSSDVCSSDLTSDQLRHNNPGRQLPPCRYAGQRHRSSRCELPRRRIELGYPGNHGDPNCRRPGRWEDRSVGKECVDLGGRRIIKKNSMIEGEVKQPTEVQTETKNNENT